MMSYRKITLMAVFTIILCFTGLTQPSSVFGLTQKPVAVTYLPIPNGAYLIDPVHSSINFAVKHMVINEVRGRFTQFSGTINYDEADVTKSNVEFSAKTTSINTDNEGRDKHLRSADFFDVEKFPEMTFKSTRIEKKGKNLIAHGDFTMHGTTKPIMIPFTLTGAIKGGGGTRFGVAAQLVLNRQDYGVAWSRTMDNGGLAIANEVTVNLNLEAIKPDPKK